MKDKIKDNAKKLAYIAPAMIGFSAIQVEKLLPPTMFPWM